MRPELLHGPRIPGTHSLTGPLPRAQGPVPLRTRGGGGGGGSGGTVHTSARLDVKSEGPLTWALRSCGCKGNGGQPGCPWALLPLPPAPALPEPPVGWDQYARPPAFYGLPCPTRGPPPPDHAQGRVPWTPEGPDSRGPDPQN